MNEVRPPLVLVNGAPASGKSQLAGWLARELGLPLIAKDAIKESLFETLGAPDEDRSRQLSRASYALVYAMAGWLLESGAGAVIDCNFHRGPAEPALRPLAARARAVLLHCQTTREEIIQRYQHRATTGERHPGHHDATALPRLLANLDAGAFSPLELDVPTLLVNTTHGYEPPLSALNGFVRAAIGLSKPTNQANENKR